MTCGTCVNSTPRPLIRDGQSTTGFLGCVLINNTDSAELHATWLNPRSACVFEPSKWTGR